MTFFFQTKRKPDASYSTIMLIRFSLGDGVAPVDDGDRLLIRHRYVGVVYFDLTLAWYDYILPFVFFNEFFELGCSRV